MPKRKTSEDDEQLVKAEARSSADGPLAKKRAYVKRTETKKGTAVPWSESEVKAVWRGVYDIIKKGHVPELAKIPEVNGRTASRLHNKLDALFKDLLK